MKTRRKLALAVLLTAALVLTLTTAAHGLSPHLAGLLATFPVITPVLAGFGNYLIPLMVGARDMVFPYVNMLSYWVYLLAVVIVAASFASKLSSSEAKNAAPL